MPKLVRNGLSVARVKNEKRPGYYADGDGLYLLVAKNGLGYFVWRGKVRNHKNRREIGIGPVRKVTLDAARKTAQEWSRIAHAGGDPKEERDRHKRADLTFEQAARKVWTDQIKKRGKSEKYREQWLAVLEAHAFPIIGARPVDAVAQSDILRILSPVWLEKPPTARLLRQRLRTVLSWARTAGHREGVNPVDGVEDGLPKQRAKVQHHTALPYPELPDLMVRLEGMNELSAMAMRFLILTAARSGEVREATWSEIDLERRVWAVPGERMKGGEPHRVPLSDAAMAVLEAVKGLDKTLVFPSPRTGRAMSDVALSRLFSRLGVPAVPHGMRSTFRDWTEECTAFPHEVKEAALAHTVKSRVERAYRRTDLFEKRRALMDAWARFCLSASRKGEVVEMRGASALCRRHDPAGAADR